MLRWTSPHRKTTPLLCRLLGHYWSEGWYGRLPYLHPSPSVITDGLGTQHVTLECRCQRCDELLPVAHVHAQAVDRVRLG